MRGRAIGLVGPAFLFACLILGGSGQGILTNLALQLGGILLLAVALIIGRGAEGKAAHRLSWLVALGLAVVLLQLVPLPPGLWSGLPGREPIVEGFAAMGGELPWLPISLAPEKTVATLLATLPALGLLAWVVTQPAGSDRAYAGAILGGALLSILLGLMQVTAGDEWYPYRFSSVGTATGVFANSNHLASLLLSTIPVLAALGVEQGRAPQKAKAGHRVAILIALIACAGAVMVGVALTGSFAALLLGGPMLAASALLFLPAVAVRAGRLAVLIAAAALIGIAVVATVGVERLVSIGGSASAAERLGILDITVRMMLAYAPVGSGLGTFQAAYPLFEDPALVSWIYVNHAHSDYLELLVELGLPGALLIVAFALWWGWRFAALWRANGTAPLVRAATLVSFGLLLHSLVDFPLRTAALSALFAWAIAMMARPRMQSGGEEPSKPRHLRLEDLE